MISQGSFQLCTSLIPNTHFIDALIAAPLSSIAGHDLASVA